MIVKTKVYFEVPLEKSFFILLVIIFFSLFKYYERKIFEKKEKKNKAANIAVYFNDCEVGKLKSKNLGAEKGIVRRSTESRFF